MTASYDPGTKGIVSEIHRLFMIKENLIKQPQTEEWLTKKWSMVEKKPKSEQTKKCSYVALRMKKEWEWYCFWEV